jgi:hypothetical protein
VTRIALLAAVVVLVVAAAVITGCSSQDNGSVTVGVVTQVSGERGYVESFIVTDESGQSLRFRPVAGLTVDGAPINSLREYLVSRERVQVDFERSDDGFLIATEVRAGR